MTDAPINLGQRILTAARLAAVMHLTDLFERESVRQRERGGADGRALTDETLPTRSAEGGAE